MYVCVCVSVCVCVCMCVCIHIYIYVYRQRPSFCLGEEDNTLGFGILKQRAAHMPCGGWPGATVNVGEVHWAHGVHSHNVSKQCL